MTPIYMEARDRVQNLHNSVIFSFNSTQYILKFVFLIISIMLSLAFDQSMTFEKKNNDIGEKKKKKHNRSIETCGRLWIVQSIQKHKRFHL